MAKYKYDLLEEEEMLLNVIPDDWYERTSWGW